MKLSLNKGFTLVEIAIVLLIVAILLGYTVAMFSVQQELGQYRKVDKQMDQISAAIIAFAQVNGRVPCPDSGVFDGVADTIDIYDAAGALSGSDGLPDGCTSYIGRLPASTLGLNGKLNTTNNLIDPWLNEYIYHVSSMSTDGNVVDLIAPNGVKNAGLTLIDAPNIFICDGSTESGGDTTCANVTGDTVVDNVSIVIVSTGKDGASFDSEIQLENTDGDAVYVASEFNDTKLGKYDDKIKWISPNLLYSKMIEAGKLP